MKLWVLMNNKNEFIAKNYSGNIFYSKDKIHQAFISFNKKNAESKIRGVHYWISNNINYKDLKAVEIEVTYKIINEGETL